VAYNLVPCDRAQPFLMPPSLQDWLPKDHLARFVVSAVSVLNLKDFYKHRRLDGWGRAAYDPAMMVALLIYAYATGTRSSRQIERRCAEDVAFRFICANEVPDHSTLARFVKDYEKAIGGLFAQVLRLAVEVGLVRMGVVALDSTRVAANASQGANRTGEWITEEVRKIVAEARGNDDADAQAPADPGDAIPKELIDENERLARLQQAKANLEADRTRRQEAYEAKLAKRKQHKEETGKEMVGRKPKPPEERKKDAERSKKANITDPDSRTMSTADSGYQQGYNAQAVVTEDQITVAVSVTNEATDFGQVGPMARLTITNLREAGMKGSVGVLVADTGYLSDDNLALEAELGVELLISTRDRTDPPRGRIPAGLTRTQLMTRKLLTKRGRGLYAKRGGAIEATFGQLRQRGMGRFRRRGLAACESEWRFEHAVHNLLKIRASGKGLPTGSASRNGAHKLATRRHVGRPGRHIWLRCRCHRPLRPGARTGFPDSLSTCD
jgi:transposase